MQIIVKKYEHFNTAMGKYISTQKQYKEEMKKGGYVSWEEGQKAVKKHNEKYNKPYEMSREAKEIISHGKSIKDKKGNIELSGRAVNKLETLGMKFMTRKDLEKRGIDINSQQGGIK